MRDIVVCLFVCLCAASSSSIKKRFGAPPDVERACDPRDGNQTFVANVDDCNSYWECVHGWPYARQCPNELVWSHQEGRCEDKYTAVNEACGFLALPPPTTIVPPQYDGVCDVPCVSNPDEECVAFSMVCDGIAHCSDASDEPSECAPLCDPDTCRPPDCRCAGSDVPEGMSASQIPQMVMITSEGAIRLEDYNHLYTQIFKKMQGNRVRDIRRNPNGCPIMGTFFAPHQFTDYVAAQHIHFEGNEIAALSVSHRWPAQYWKDASVAEWAAEFGGEKQMMSTFGHINDVVGMRAPYLQMGGDRQFEMMSENGYTWDASWSTNMNDPPLWPFTLDYAAKIDCSVPPCPVHSHPGIWEVPLVNWLDTNDTLCAEVDNCYLPNDKEEALQLFRQNFRRHYEQNRAPFGIHLRARWFYSAHYNLEALQDFLAELEQLNDVWLVTISDVIRWMRNPVPNSRAEEFFDCDFTNRLPACLGSLLCEYMNVTHMPNSEDHPGDRFLHTCADQCPDVYPWLGNPTGSANP